MSPPYSVRRVWLALLVALACLAPPLAPPLAAQSVDSTAAAQLKRATAKLDSAIANTRQYCSTRRPYGYMCPTAQRQETEARAIVASVSATYVPVPPKPIPPPPAAATVTILGTATSLRVGGTLQLYAEPKSAAGVTLTTPVQWGLTTGSTDYGSISGTGLLTGLRAGSVTVVVRADSAASTRLYAVTDSSPPVPPDTTPKPPTADSIMMGPATRAELPRSRVDVRYPTVTRVVQVPATANLQAALDACQSGDELRLALGAAWTGNYKLPVRANQASGWCTIRADATDAQLGSPGTRMTPSRAASVRLPRIITPNYSPALATAGAPQRIRLVGVELVGAPTTTDMNMVLSIGDYGTSVATGTPAYFVVDRSYLHAGDSTNVKRCSTMNGAQIAFVDSWLAKCHHRGSDSQALVAWNGAGPFTIVNNHLEAGHEVVMFGGADPWSQAYQPADVTLVGNHITRPLDWFGVFQQKTLLETKDVIRYLIEGNRIENVKADAQAGFALLLKSENQQNTAPYTTTSDVTVRYNDIRCVGGVFNISGHGSSGTPSITSNRYTIHDNVVTNVNVAPCVAQGIAVQVLSQLTNLLFAHNTIMNATSSAGAWPMDGGPFNGMSVHSNVLYIGPYGVKGTGLAQGKATLDALAPGSLFSGNVLVKASCAVYPAGNTCPAILPTTLPLGLDGRPVGADMAKVAQYTAGAVVAP